MYLHKKGTFILHSETPKRNGGDYDFDQVCVVEGNRILRLARIDPLAVLPFTPGRVPAFVQLPASGHRTPQNIEA